MKTLEVLENMHREAPKEALFKQRELRECIGSLNEIYQSTRRCGLGPYATVGEWAGKNGIDRTTEVLATVINRIDFDGRIDSSIKDWARSQPECWDKDAARSMNIVADIHAAHLNQIARAYINMFRLFGRE